MSTPTASDVQTLFNGKAHFWQRKYGPAGKLRSRVERFAERLEELAPPPARILDLGCGTGDISRALAQWGFQVTGCDIAEEMLAVAKGVGVGSRELGVGNRKTGVANRELGVGNREPGVGSRELGVGNREMGVGSRELAVEDPGSLTPDPNSRTHPESLLPTPNSPLPVSHSVLPSPNSLRESEVQWTLLPPDWKQLPFADGSFDGVVASSVFEYLGDVPGVAAELGRVLRPGGTLLLTVPNPYNRLRQVEAWLVRPAANRRLSGWVERIPRLASYAAYLRLSRNRWNAQGWHAALAGAGFEPLDPQDFSETAWRAQARAPLVLLAVRKAVDG